jgi:hypothetical protein
VNCSGTFVDTQEDAFRPISQSRRRKVLCKCVFEVKQLKYTLFLDVLPKDRRQRVGKTAPLAVGRSFLPVARRT